ncbi:hypothetical protein CH378_16685 [Leptospira kmetyi]|uniref:Uncharacterized protein n=1 Tax=Leptospira kmetyi TaxID=408139 RepID=A0ABX4N697_9LEPT|nr:hypothetical protein CH378_16685 [Leptospira kmetyi]
MSRKFVIFIRQSKRKIPSNQEVRASRVLEARIGNSLKTDSAKRIRRVDFDSMIFQRPRVISFEFGRFGLEFLH